MISQWTFFSLAIFWMLSITQIFETKKVSSHCHKLGPEWLFLSYAERAQREAGEKRRKPYLYDLVKTHQIHQDFLNSLIQGLNPGMKWPWEASTPEKFHNTMARCRSLKGLLAKTTGGWAWLLHYCCKINWILRSGGRLDYHHGLPTYTEPSFNGHGPFSRAHVSALGLLEWGRWPIRERKLQLKLHPCSHRNTQSKEKWSQTVTASMKDEGKHQTAKRGWNMCLCTRCWVCEVSERYLLIFKATFQKNCQSLLARYFHS